MIKDIDYILSHFEEPIFPREMMTATSNGKFSVNSKEEMFKKYKEANFVDCRINAYPVHTGYKGIVRYPPNFVFIDLDLSNFKDLKTLDKTRKSYFEENRKIVE